MNTNHIKILTMPVAVTAFQDAVQQIIEATYERKGRYVCVSNVHMCMEAFDCRDFNHIVNSANMVVPDGVPLVWGLKAKGQKMASQVRGSDLFLSLCKKAQEKNIPIGLYGGTSESLKDLLSFLKKKYPTLQIPFFSSPPFRPLTEREHDNYDIEINKSEVRILFVGIGCPKQEIWMAKHCEKLSCVMVGIGAAFDFFSGRKKQAPRWMQKYGLEWAFRLAIDPRHLWKRYLIHNPRFIWYFLKQLVNEKRDQNQQAKRIHKQ